VAAHQVGDLVLLLQTIEWDDSVILKGEICIISEVYDATSPDDGIFFDYAICAADGMKIDVWYGEIESLA